MQRTGRVVHAHPHSRPPTPRPPAPSPARPARTLACTHPRPHALVRTHERRRGHLCGHAHSPPTCPRLRPPFVRVCPRLSPLSFAFTLTPSFVVVCVVVCARSLPMFVPSFGLVCTLVGAIVFVRFCHCSCPPAFAPLSMADIHRVLEDVTLFYK